MIKLIQGDSYTELKKLPDESVDCCISSPPYWALRTYLPNEVKLKNTLSAEEKETVLKELTVLGIKGIIR